MILHSSADEFSDWLARAKESALIDFSLSNNINMRHPYTILQESFRQAAEMVKTKS